MKKSYLVLTAIMCMSLFTYAHNGDPLTKNPTETNKKSNTISLSNIFISDYEGETLYVDFEAVTDDIATIKLVGAEKTLMKDNVEDLPGNIIYELNLGALKEGTYEVELLTKEGIIIQKQLVID